MMELLKPKSPIKVSITLTGSKSISNRLLILNEVLGMNLEFGNLSTSEDTLLLQNALGQVKKGGEQMIDIQHAGTDMRFLTALLATRAGTWTLTGSNRMKQRPIGELVNALRQLGAEIHYLEKENFPPLQIYGKELSGGTLKIDSSQSSQFVSALLLIAPALKNGMQLSLEGDPVSYPYIHMTLRLLNVFGIRYGQSGNTISVLPSSAQLPALPVEVESDWSSASYWYSICALSPGSEIRLRSLPEQSLQADAVLPALFQPLGVITEFGHNHSVLLRQNNVSTSAFQYDFTHCPDIAPTLAATCFGLGIAAELRGLKTLKIKESDRILALKTELEKLGAMVQATDESLQISGTPTLNSGIMSIETYNDHRMAMSFAPLALVLGHMNILDPGVVTKSYPGFWEDLKSAGFNVNLQP
jgi:3-phosphoshikimate 1-carboxyvinyltransferase